MSIASNSARIEYPSSDGKPMADNTLQYEWIVTLKGNLDAIFEGDPNVFVAGDLLWYPVEGNNKLRAAPDAMVAFGRPKGYRGCYMQWDEGGIAPQVVFEVLSPGNRKSEMARKRQFYETHGVEEYYVLDPYKHLLEIWLRGEAGLQRVTYSGKWVSPRTEVRFEVEPNAVLVFRPNGTRFLSFAELNAERNQAVKESAAANAIAREQTQIAERETQRAEQETQRAEQETARAAAAVARAERLEARLRELGQDYTAE